MKTVNLSEAQIRALLAAGNQSRAFMHPAMARSLGYAMKTLRKALEVKP